MFGIMDKVKAAANTVTSAALDITDAGGDAVRAVLADVALASADLEAIGFLVRDVEVFITIPPAVTVFIQRVGDPTDEAFAAALARRQGSTTAWLLIKLTQQAYRWSASLKMGERRCSDYALDLGIRPAVRLLFTRQDVAAPNPVD